MGGRGGNFFDTFSRISESLTYYIFEKLICLMVLTICAHVPGAH